MSKLVAPHGGGDLKPLLKPAAERADALHRAGTLKPIPLTSREVSDVFMLGMSAYTPLDGFMGHDDWKGSVTKMQLAEWRLLADSHHAVTIPGRCRRHRHREEVALADGSRRNPGHHAHHREIRDRQGARVP